MPSRISDAVLLVVLGLVGASTNGCGRRQGLGTQPNGGAGSTASAAGTSGVAGSGDSTGAAGAGMAGASAAAGTAGVAGSSGPAGTAGVAGATGAVDASGLAGSSGAAGAPVPGPLDGDVSKIVPTLGCGQPGGQPLGTFVRYTIETTGTKPADCADSQCGPWSYTREYFLRLPSGYDAGKAYPITFEGPGCGGKGDNLFSLPGLASSAIRVGLSPSVDAQAFHATNPGQGCFDDHDGDDSVDWVFYENLYDKLAAKVCFDRNRVFIGGDAGGGSVMANELGCKYAGDALRPVRGVMASSGGLPALKYQPTCSSKPMAGVWISQVNDPTYPFSQTTSALARAMAVNGCAIGNSFQTAELDPFPIGASYPNTPCETVKGCPARFPLVICPVPGFGHSGNEGVANPAWASFLDLFAPTP